MDNPINIIRPRISSGRAEAIIAAKAGPYVPRFKKIVYYPYLWVHFRYSFEKIYTKTFDAYILVDLIQNQASTTDRFEPAEESPEGKTVLTGDVPEDEAFATAKTYLLHSVMHHMKIMSVPVSTVEERMILHKPFLLTECIHRTKDPFHVIVDGLTGKYEILPER